MPDCVCGFIYSINHGPVSIESTYGDHVFVQFRGNSLVDVQFVFCRLECFKFVGTCFRAAYFVCSVPGQKDPVVGCLDAIHSFSFAVRICSDHLIRLLIIKNIITRVSE
jgi:hypothetical protein